jgi:hypothetical protein
MVRMKYIYLFSIEKCTRIKLRLAFASAESGSTLCALSKSENDVLIKVMHGVETPVFKMMRLKVLRVGKATLGGSTFVISERH